MTQLALSFDLPRNPFPLNTQRGMVYEIIINRGEAYMPDFLRAGIPEFRSRINEIDKELRKQGWMIKRRRVYGCKYVLYSIGRM